MSRNIKSIAVIGPSADVPRYGDYTPSAYGYEPITVLEGIRNLLGDAVEIDFEQGTEIINGDIETIENLSLLCSDTDCEGDELVHGLVGEYFNNEILDGDPVLTRIEKNIYFNFSMQKVDVSVDSSVFSARWSGYLVAGETYDGILGLNCNDKSRVWVDDELVIDNWDAKGDDFVGFSFTEGQRYKIRIEYCKISGGGAIVRFGWNTNCDRIQVAADIAKGKDAAVIVVGENERTCGEGMDRASLDLPGKQLELIKAVHATGTPIVVVLMNGRPLSIPWVAEHVPAILEAWYPAEKGGQAVAEVLFGDYNPAGRLPITVPKSVSQLPLFYNIYYAEQKEYVDTDSKPLFRFGHGLSYTTFGYSALRINPVRIDPADKVIVTFDVTNTGAVEGDEVVQLYINDVISSLVRPRKELKRFERIRLKPRETRTVAFELGFDDLCLYDRHIQRVVEPGIFEVMIGGSLDYALKGEFVVE